MNRFLIIVLIILLSACATVDVGSYITPGTTLDVEDQYYIIFSGRDEQSLHQLLKTEIELRGYDVTSGFEDRIPEGTDYLIRYGGQWQWDVTWYLLNMDVKIYKPEPQLMVASAHSQRTSLVRKPASSMVKEVLDQLFSHQRKLSE